VDDARVKPVGDALGAGEICRGDGRHEAGNPLRWLARSPPRRFGTS
jgi:hypothetical protein